jgi:putative transcriptional regulator
LISGQSVSVATSNHGVTPSKGAHDTRSSLESIHLRGVERGYHDATMLTILERARRASFAWLAVAAVAAAGAVPAAAQSVTNGALLVASPQMSDPMFARAVVLVLRHDDEGSIGVVLNRPTNLMPAAIFPELMPGLGNYAGSLFRGGPIAPTRLLYIVRGLAAATVNGPEVLDKVFLSIDDASLPDMTRLADGINDLRLYAGHAAWVPGQLQAEINAGGWEVLPGTAELVFDDDPGGLWTELEGRGTSGDNVVAAL